MLIRAQFKYLRCVSCTLAVRDLNAFCFVRDIYTQTILDKMVIKVYIASSTGSVAVKKHQQAVVGFLEANRINFQEVDITMLEEERLWMYHNIPKNKQPEKGKPVPPQIFNEDRYCGDYEDFFESKENNAVFAFLGLKSQQPVQETES